MARDDADIDRAKSGVPEIHRPRHAAGALTNHFSSVDSLRESTPLQGSEIAERERFNLGMGFIGRDSSETAPGFILSGAIAAARAVQITATEKRKNEDERFALGQMKQALEQRLAELDREIAAIDKRLEDIRQRRIVIADQMEALDDVERLRRSGKLDPNNPAHARLLRVAGISESEARGGDLATIIALRRQILGNEDDALGNEHNSLLKYRGVVAYERQGVVGALGEIENADTDEARILAERRAKTVLGSQQLGEAATQTTDCQARIVAADAVGVAQESERFNRNAVAGNRSEIVGTATPGFELDTPLPTGGAPLPR